MKALTAIKDFFLDLAVKTACPVCGGRKIALATTGDGVVCLHCGSPLRMAELTHFGTEGSRLRYARAHNHPDTYGTKERAMDEEFKVEEHVKVYLTWDAEAGRWVIDPVTLDGHPLYGLDGGPETLYGNGVTLTPEEQVIFDAAAAANLPTGEEVYHLLAEHLAPVVFKVGLAPADAGVKPETPDFASGPRAAGLEMFTGVLDVLHDREAVPAEKLAALTPQQITDLYEDFIAPAIDRIEAELS